MPNPVASILRAATRRPLEPLSILTFCTHERYETGLSKTGHNFYAYRSPQVKNWNTVYAPVPANYTLLNQKKGHKQLPPDVEFDLVLSQNKFGQFQLAQAFARQLHLPLVSLEHTLPHTTWNQAQLDQCLAMRGDVNVFISEFSRERWGWKPEEAEVVHHGVDTETFSPAQCERKSYILSVVNQLNTPERKWCCGYDMWEEATKGLPRLHLGESPDGWSQPAKSIPDLVNHYREAAVFVDTASASPIPTVVLEAMACGAVVVSRGNAMVPEVIEHGVNGFICPTVDGMRKQLTEVLKNPGLYEHIGRAARQTILNRFSMDTFVTNWDRVLRKTANIVFTGET